MNREIRFRAWDSTANEMIDWQELCDSAAQLKIFTTPDVFDITVMQSTGLLDKNGTEIYEGDILESWEYAKRGEVSFDNGAFVISSDRYEPSPIVVSSELEVIGDIYTTPELLNPKGGN